jgi:hypothetical protein
MFSNGTGVARARVAAVGIALVVLAGAAAVGATQLGGDAQPTQLQDSDSSGFDETVPLAEAETRLGGETANDTAGWSVANAGDVNGDGVDDLIVGAPRANTTGPNAGAAYIVYGPAEPGNVSLSDADLTLRGEKRNDLAGYSAASRDATESGVVVGAPGTPVTTATRLIRLPTRLLIRPPTAVRATWRAAETRCRR